MIPEGNPKVKKQSKGAVNFENTQKGSRQKTVSSEMGLVRKDSRQKRAGVQPAGRSSLHCRSKLWQTQLLNHSTGRSHCVGLPRCTKVCKDQGCKQPIQGTKASHNLSSTFTLSQEDFHVNAKNKKHKKSKSRQHPKVFPEIKNTKSKSRQHPKVFPGGPPPQY